MSIEKCTIADRTQRWEDINFKKAAGYVKKLQKRIAVAYQRDDLDKVEVLQHTLIHSFYPKVLAVKTVTSSSGKDTPGVDGVLWATPEEKYDAIFQLRRRGYRPLPLKRIYIPKGNRRLRPLSIPTMKDRAMQTLYRFALEPIGQLTADSDSFAYLPGRGAKCAVIRLGDVLLDCQDFQWVMKADIKACFDNISHEWVIGHIPIDKIVLRKFLGCGYVENQTLYPMEKGVPQGGCISPTICNMALDGLEGLLKECFGQDVHLIRYADDIIIVGKCRKHLVQAVTPVVECFLLERGLSLSKEKTGYFPVSKKVHFLGYGFYIEGGNFIAEPLQKRVAGLLNQIVITCRQYQYPASQTIYDQLGRQIRGWLNYYAGVAPVQSLYDVEYEVAALLHSLTGDNKLVEFAWKLFSRIKLTN